MKISLFTATLPSAGYQDETDIIKFNNLVENVGYDSVLFVYHSKSVDFLVPIVRYLNLNHKFKYLLAIRTYAISPEYLAMIFESFNKFFPDRLSFNIVAGDLHAEENSVENVIGISDLIDTTFKRTQYTAKWLEKFLKLVKNKPHIVVSGYSDVTNNTAEQYADEQLLMLSTYKTEMLNKIKNPKVLVSTPIYFTDDLNSNFDIQNLKKTNTMIYESAIIGTEIEVMQKIKNLSKIGVSNCMVYVLDLNQETKLHKVMKRLIKELKNENF